MAETSAGATGRAACVVIPPVCGDGADLLRPPVGGARGSGYIACSQAPRASTCAASARASSSAIRSAVSSMERARARPSMCSGLVTPMIGVVPLAVAEDACLLAAAVEQAVVVLHGLVPVPGLATVTPHPLPERDRRCVRVLIRHDALVPSPPTVTTAAGTSVRSPDKRTQSLRVDAGSSMLCAVGERRACSSFSVCAHDASSARPSALGLSAAV